VTSALQLLIRYLSRYTHKENIDETLIKRKICIKFLEFVKAKEQTFTNYFMRAVFQGIFYNIKVIYN